MQSEVRREQEQTALRGPTQAPTQSCTSLWIAGSDSYDGVYNKSGTEINDMDWWQARDYAAKLYYYVGISGKRWKLEGETYSFWAPSTQPTVEELDAKIAGTDFGTNSACGALPTLNGWWVENKKTADGATVSQKRWKMVWSRVMHEKREFGEQWKHGFHFEKRQPIQKKPCRKRSRYRQQAFLL